MKRILTPIFFLVLFKAESQSIDTVIDYKIYTSYFSYQLQTPVMVKYDLCHGGGTCNRAGDRFKDIGLIAEATNDDYKASGYDKGHLADSKDFAFDCTKQEQTFRFINCLPQTPTLNRGIWKHYDSLEIICGGEWDEGFQTIGNGVAVPSYCWKIVYDYTQQKITHILWFPNDTSDNVEELTSIEDLKNKLPFAIPF